MSTQKKDDHDKTNRRDINESVTHENPKPNSNPPKPRPKPDKKSEK